MEIRKEILDELIRDYKNPEDLIGRNGILRQLEKALLERAMQGELTHELGYEKNARSSGSTREPEERAFFQAGSLKAR